MIFVVDKKDTTELDLHKVFDLLYFEGPIWSYFIDKDKNPYIYLFADHSNEYCWWFVFSVIEENLQKFLNKELSMFQLIKTASAVWLHPYTEDTQTYYKMSLSTLFEKYKIFLPTEDSYYDQYYKDIQEVEDKMVQSIVGCEQTKEDDNCYQCVDFDICCETHFPICNVENEGKCHEGSISCYKHKENEHA